MILKTDFRRDAHQRELGIIFPEGFGINIHYYNMHEAIGKMTPLHWHPFFEIVYMLKGESIFFVDTQEVRLLQGDALFINLNAVHSTYCVPGEHPVTVAAVHFLPEFLSGKAGSSLEQKYLRPITDNHAFSFWQIRPDSLENVHMLELLGNLIQCYDEEKTGFEFKAHALTGEFWCNLLQTTRDFRAAHTVILSNDRIRPMLEYIQKNFPERISLSDIAEVGAIGIRECSRIFQKYVHMSPVEYVNFCRLHRAAEELLTTDKTVIAISESCGFSSAGYFGKRFSREFGVTPREYRTQYRKNSGGTGLTHPPVE